jgi:hypothetical protein
MLYFPQSPSTNHEQHTKQNTIENSNRNASEKDVRPWKEFLQILSDKNFGSNQQL